MSAASQLRIGAARRVELDAPGQRIAALRSGSDDAPPVLLVPGYTGSKEDFGPILDPIAAAGLRAVAIDLPGQLDSPALPEPADYRPERLGDVVRELARGLGGACLLLGHSYGGLVARAAVLAEPRLFGSLALLSSGPARLGGGRRASIDALEPVLARGGLPAVWAAMEAAALGDPRYVVPPTDVQEFFRRRFFASSPVMLQGMADALRAEPDRVAELRAVGLPILVAHGAGDDAWPPHVQREMAQRLGADYAVIAGAAHSPAVENPAATVAALLAFWSRPIVG
jgi:pimeloyl-ACP methyl ester carboxylesterase